MSASKTISLTQLPPPLEEVSQSMTRTFQRCKVKYAFRYLFRMSRKKIDLKLVIGTAVHAAFEIILSNSTEADEVRLKKAIDRLNREFDKVAENTDPALAVDQDKLEYARAQAAAVVRAWFIVHGGNQWNRVQSEVVVRAPEAGPFVGKIDGIVIDEDGRLWVLEHKTRASLANQDFVNALQLDHQALWYLVLGDKVLEREDVRKRIWAFISEGKKSKKAMPKDFRPQISGLMFDAIQKPLHKTADSFEALTERMVQAMVEDQEKYFFLQPILIDQNTINHARHNFELIMKEMKELTLENMTQNFTACHYIGEGNCEFQPICNSGVDVHDLKAVAALDQMELYEERSPYTELEEHGEE